MIGRRDLLLGGGCLLAAGAAYQLTPRRHLNLLGDKKMESVIPTAFGDWTSQGDATLVKPVAEGSLAARLYSQSISRVYSNPQGDEVMVLVAYGDNQSDLLQLHRPEACYPAVGFSLLYNQPAVVPLGPAGVTLPSRRVTAERSDRREDIVYWTRLGEYLPTDGTAQGKARLETAMQGYIADGVLIRCSKLSSDDAAAFADLDAFIREMLRAVTPKNRPALVGTSLSRAMQA
jgi:EpsI family protein